MGGVGGGVGRVVVALHGRALGLDGDLDGELLPRRLVLRRRGRPWHARLLRLLRRGRGAHGQELALRVLVLRRGREDAVEVALGVVVPAEARERDRAPVEALDVRRVELERAVRRPQAQAPLVLLVERGGAIEQRRERELAERARLVRRRGHLLRRLEHVEDVEVEDRRVGREVPAPRVVRRRAARQEALVAAPLEHLRLVDERVDPRRVLGRRRRLRRLDEVVVGRVAVGGRAVRDGGGLRGVGREPRVVVPHGLRVLEELLELRALALRLGHDGVDAPPLRLLLAAVAVAPEGHLELRIVEGLVGRLRAVDRRRRRVLVVGDPLEAAHGGASAGSAQRRRAAAGSRAASTLLGC